jgi:hypothetical protein
MKKISLALALAGLLLVAKDNPAIVGNDRPPWATDEMVATVTRIGIDPKTDSIEQNNTHWRFRARHKVRAAAYNCPTGSTVDISQAVILVMAPKNAFCHGPDKTRSDFITLSMDGAVVTLVQ